MKHYALDQSKFLSSTEAEGLELLLRRYLSTADQRDALMILVALRTGARATEVLNLRREDFNPESGTLFVRGIKGSNDREIPIPPWLARSYQNYLKRVDGKPFNMSYQRLNQIWLIWRPVKKKFHSLRHTFAIRTYSRTRDIKLCQIALGHRSINNTMIYLDYVYKNNELRKILF